MADERTVTVATIWPGIVQLALGFGNLMFPAWLVMHVLSGQATTEGMEMFARKGVFSLMGRAGAVATVLAIGLTAVEPSAAFAGSAPKANGITATSGTSGATDISARR